MKLTKYILSFAAAAGLLAGCQTPEIVQIAAPEDVVPAVLHELELDEIAITANNQQETVTFSWDAADYGAATSVRYSVEAALSEEGKKVTIVSGLGKTEVEVTYEDLNRVLFNDLAVPEGQATELKVYVGSIIYSGAVTASYPKVYSEPKSLTVTVTAAEKVYPMIYVIGAFNSWAAGTTQELFEFVPDSKVYSGMIGFNGKAAEGWKIRGNADKWINEEGNWGLNSADPAPDAEAAEINMYNDGGSSDIKIYSKNFYHMTFDTGALKLKMNLSFDQIGVIGSFNDWGADVVMNFDTVKQKFYADVEFAADAEFKFRLDGAWTTSYGTGADGFLTSDNGANITAKAGNYRVYLNMNNLGEITYELNKGDYGASTPEPEPEPENPDQPVPPTMVGWGIVGSITNWGNLTEENTYIPDVALASDGTWYVVKDVEMPADAQIKFRKDGGWDAQWGAGADAFAANTEMTLSSDGGSGNITPVAGTYDIYLNPETGKAWFINDGSYPGGGTAKVESEWGLIGDLAACNNWNVNITLYEDGDYAVAKGVAFAAGNQFKFRKGNGWGVELTYEGQITIDAKLDLIDGTGGKQNSSIAVGGSFDVYLAKDLSCYYVMTPGKTPAEAGEAEKVILDYSDCQMELVGSGVVEQTGTTPDTAWGGWGQTLLSSNTGKPAKSGDVYTWSWSNVQLSVEGWKIRTFNAAASGGVNNFDCGDGNVDKVASANVQASSDGNIYVTAGNYNITLVIDAAADTKKITIVSAN